MAHLLVRRFVVAGAEQRRADLARQGAALQRLEPGTVRLEVGGLGAAQMLERLGVGGHAAGLVAGLEQPGLRLFPVLGAGVVVRQQAREFVETIGKQQLDGMGHALVDAAPVLGQDAAVGRLLHQPVLEDVFEVGQALLLADQLGLLQLGEALAQLAARLAERFEHAIEEAAADHRGQLQGLLGLVVEPVDACQDQALQRVGQLYLVDLPDQLPAARRGVAHQRAVADQRADHLLHEEGVALGAAQDLFAQGLRQVEAARQVVDQRQAVLRRQRRELQVVEPGLRVLGGKAAHALHRSVGMVARREHEQQRHARSQRQQVIGQVDRGLVGPMPVFERQHQRLARCQQLDELAHAEEDLAAQAHAVEVLQALFVLGGDGQRQHRRQVGQDLVRALAEQGLEAALELGPAALLAVVFGDAEAVLEELDEGPVAEVPAERQRASFQPETRAGVGPETPRLGHQPRLADARLALQHEDAAAAALQRLQRRPHHRQLGVAADQRRRDAQIAEIAELALRR